MLAVTAAAALVLILTRTWAGSDPLRRHLAVSVANLVMLAVVWLDLCWRGESWASIGLTLRVPDWKSFLATLRSSLCVCIAALAAVVLASVVMANLVGIPEGADMSEYDYLQGNLPLLLLAMVSVYVTASIGEEIIYRGFLINRVAEIGSCSRTAYWVAVLFSAVVFGLIHSDWALMGIVQMTSMGVAFGISYLLLDKKLWALILAHAYLDTMLIVQLYLGSG
jgi:membrane protease YdiL (CAAX protease family)